MPELEEPVIFVRTGWLKYYDYTRDTDDPVAGGSFNDENVGSEANNFRVIGELCYGYARTGKNDGYNFFRTWPTGSQRKTRLTGVKVIIVARHPDSDKGQVVVGWYNNAAMHDTYQERDDLFDEEEGDNDYYGCYNFEAHADDCLVLPMLERTFSIPKGEGAMSQANVYYCFEPDGSPRTFPWIFKALKFVKKYAGKNLIRKPVTKGRK